MKKLLALLLAVVMVVGLMAACNKTSEDTKATTEPTQGGSAEQTQPTEATTEATEPLPGYMDAAHPERYGGHLNVRVCTPPTTLDPIPKANQLWAWIYNNVMFENALSRDADNNIQPGVCDFEISDDMKTLTLWVLDGITFHNGDTVDIYDVEASLKRGFDTYGSMISVVTPYVESAEVEGDKLVIKFTEYNEDIWNYMACNEIRTPIQPKEIVEKYNVKNEAGKWERNASNMEDCIGTGPYKLSGFENSVYISVERYEDYKIRGEGLTGAAGPKYAYMDSITFYYNGDDSNATMALLAGDYDVVECISSDYIEMVSKEGIVETICPSTLGCALIFNSLSTESLVSKYPSLRKAIAAAVDFQLYMDAITDEQGKLGGCPFLSPLYETDLFTTQDYYGAANVEVAKKYLEAAKAEGWNGTDPIQVIRPSNRDDIPVMLKAYLDAAGIPVQITMMEQGAFDEQRNQKDSSKWDVDFTWPDYTLTPTAFTGHTFNGDPETLALLEEMKRMSFTSDEYIAKAKELAQIMVDDASFVHMGNSGWYWYHPDALNINDEGLYRYFWNSYWDNPADHPAK